MVIAGIIGNNFNAKNMGFENTAGALKHQAVAIRVLSDESIFYNCRFDGYQDTLYAHSHRQFYRDCTISGTIDFLFGDAAAVFQNCTLLVRKPLPNQACPITAHGREDPRAPTGFVIQGCTIAGDPDYLAVKATSKAYLGRPWREYSRTIIMNTFIPDFVAPAGWSVWLGDFALNTLFYSEVGNTGPGASTANRVTWAGIKKLTDEEILQYTPALYIQGDSWIPGKGVPYISGHIGGNSSGAEPGPAEPGSVNSTTGSNATGSGSNTTESGNATAAAPLAAAPLASTSNTTSGLDSASPTTSPSASPSASASDTASPSASVSGTASPKASESISPSASTAAPPLASASDSGSGSASVSPTASTTSSVSPSASAAVPPSASP